MKKIFVSYAHEDGHAAVQITEALTKSGLDPWLDAQELRSGDNVLERIGHALEEADVYILILSRIALTKPWVSTEMRMAMTREIEMRRPRVVVLRLDDCQLPIEVRHKLFLDFREDFATTLDELVANLRDETRVVPTPKQTILAEMIANAGAELWSLLRRGVGDDDWGQQEVADAIRKLNSEELEAAVSIGWSWSGQQYKIWAKPAG